jgi:transposase
MIALLSGARVWLANGHTNMRKGYQSLALLVQETLRSDPDGGHLFVFRGVAAISSNAYGSGQSTRGVHARRR